MANKESIAKTRLGMVATFQDLFDSVHYIKEERSVNHGQVYPAGHMFLSVERSARAFGMPGSFRMREKQVLCCRPCVEVPQFSPCPAPSAGMPWVAQPSNALHVIRWSCGDYLVLFIDPTGLRNEWLAFVPSDQTIKLVEA